MRKTGPNGPRSRVSRAADAGRRRRDRVAHRGLHPGPRGGVGGQHHLRPVRRHRVHVGRRVGQRVPVRGRRLEGRLLPDPAQLLGRLHRCRSRSSNSDTADWAYVVKGDFPYSNWMAWYLYNRRAQPLFKFSDTDIDARRRLDEPVRRRATRSWRPTRSFTIYFMPSDHPAARRCPRCRPTGKNVALLPAGRAAPTASPSSPAATGPSPTTTSATTTGSATAARPTRRTPPSRRSSPTRPPASSRRRRSTTAAPQSQLPQRLWYDRDDRQARSSPSRTPRVPTDERAPGRPARSSCVQTGSVVGHAGRGVPAVTGARTRCSSTGTSRPTRPYADVQSAPPAGNPPDACGGYVMANLPNDVVSLVHIPQVPSFPDYTGATASTTQRLATTYDVQFYSVVIYGARRSSSTPSARSRTPRSATARSRRTPTAARPSCCTRSRRPQDQVEQIAAVVKANGWNLLRSGEQTDLAPNLLVIREKGQNPNWTERAERQRRDPGRTVPAVDRTRRCRCRRTRRPPR